MAEIQNPEPLPDIKEPLPDIKKRTEIHPVWWALVLVIVGAGGAVGIIKFIDDHIQDQLTLRLEHQVSELIAHDPVAAQLKSERQEAAAALAKCTTIQENATAKSVVATEQIDNAKRAATETLAAADQLRRLADISQLGSKIDAAIADPAFRQQVISRVLPPGAVVPFDSSTGCPDGWSIFEKAGGRTLVGAGKHTNQDETGSNLPNYISDKLVGNKGIY